MLGEQVTHVAGAFSAAGFEAKMRAQFTDGQLSFTHGYFDLSVIYRITYTNIHLSLPVSRFIGAELGCAG
jgi:hypothetical protein